MTRPLSPIDVVTASAGTGKTHRLTGAYIDAVAAGTAPGAILATTFTRKAAAELMERIRSRLLAAGRGEEARDVLAARIGTVNALFGRIAAEFALEAGRSPVADVVGEDRSAALFAAAADGVIRRHGAAIEPAARRLRVEDWRGLVQDIGARARQNGIAAGDLMDSARRSLDGLLALLPPPDTEAERLDRALADAVAAATAAIEEAGDTGVRKTAEALILLKDAAVTLSGGRPLAWVEWVRLTKLDPGAKWKSVAQAVVEAASAHAAHPRLHADLRGLVEGVFRCAADALDEYEGFKRAQGLVDFVDQEHEALALLGRDDVRRRLAERVELALVDEFQDTSPIQLALFLALAGVVRRSVWVGDAKQAIYGFRGTDPALIGAVVAQVPPATGGARERLARSYRSCPGLVAFHNDLFGAAFPTVGIAREDALVPECERIDGPDQPPPLEVWTLSGKNWNDALAALVQGVAALLAVPDAHPVGERGQGDGGRADGLLRPLRAADIAVLCRSNERCGAVADRLAAAGLKVAVGRQGLIATPEAGLALAALRYLVDPADTLAMVEMAHAGASADAQPPWLEEWLRPDAAQRAREASPALRALDEARARLLHLTPVEALEVAIVAGGVAEQVKRWGDAGERLANLDALRGLARSYEDDCRARRGAATAGGLIGFLAGVDKGGAQPPSADPEAVQVLTYHQSKGLEWPVVILLDLQGGPEPSPFGLSVEGPAEGIDPWHPLAGRWLRFWPWPYDAQRKGVQLDVAADASPEMAEARSRAHAEAVRLMYVGMTRARDYLILAVRPRGTGWLDALTAPDGTPVLTLPAGEGTGEIRAAGRPHPAMARILSAPEEEGRAEPAPPEPDVFTLTAVAPVVHPPLRLAPSHWEGAGEGAATPEVRRRIALGDRLPLPSGVDMTRLGEALHAFLAIDRPDDPPDLRLAQARRLLDRWDVPGVAVETLAEAGDRLWRTIADRWPGAEWRTEVPVHGRLGLQRVTGRIDLLLEAADGLVIIDHKSFPGPHVQWPARALEHAPQLALYRRLVEAATGRTVIGTFIHMPVVGTLLEVDASNTVGNGD